MKSHAERGEGALDVLVPGEDNSIDVLLILELDGGVLLLLCGSLSSSVFHELVRILRFRGGSSIACVADDEDSNQAVRLDSFV